MNINGYILKEELKNASSGFSKWGFAVKNGEEYFIKELINPVYPIDRSVMTEEMFQEKIAYCTNYENRFKTYYEKINNASRGNLVRINEFFRHDSRYYLITEKISGKALTMDDISKLDNDKKNILMRAAAYCFYDLHYAGIVHSDVKPNNILVKKTKRGNYVAKLIDFDSGFFKDEKIEGEDLVGDLTYLPPETFLAMYGEDVQPDEKADIFSLGLVFHEYYCGNLPAYNEEEYYYPFEAVLDGQELKLSGKMLPDKIESLIKSMLDVDPKKRPSAEEVIIKLNELIPSFAMTVGDDPMGDRVRYEMRTEYIGAAVDRRTGSIKPSGSSSKLRMSSSFKTGEYKSASEGGVSYSPSGGYTATPSKSPEPERKKADAWFKTAGDL